MSGTFPALFEHVRAQWRQNASADEDTRYRCASHTDNIGGQQVVVQHEGQELLPPRGRPRVRQKGVDLLHWRRQLIVLGFPCAAAKGSAAAKGFAVRRLGPALLPRASPLGD